MWNKDFISHHRLWVFLILLDFILFHCNVRIYIFRIIFLLTLMIVYLLVMF